MVLDCLLIFLSFCSLTILSYQLHVANGEYITDNDVQCVLRILNNYFDCNDSITLVFSNSNSDKLIKAINNYDCYTIRVRSFKFQDWLVRTNGYIIIVEDVNGLPNDMNELTRDTLWNPRARFIFLFYNVEHTDLKKSFELFSKLNIYEVILLNQMYNKDIELHTYFPFHDNECGKSFDKIVNLGICGLTSNETELFSNNSERISLQNCSITVMANEDVPNIILDTSNFTVLGKYVSGLEQYLLDTIAAIEKITIDYRYSTADVMFGVVLPNRTTTGILNTLQNGDVTMAVGGFVLIKNRIEIFDFIWGYNYAKFILLTPTNDENVWKKVYREFGLQTWLLIILAYFCMSIFTFVSKGMWLSKRFDCLIINMKLWAYFYGQTDRRLLQETKPKAIVILWALFTFFIFSFYNTAYYSLITGHVKEQRIIETDEINSIPYKPCVSDPIRIFYKYAYNFKLPEGSNNPDCRYTESAMNTVASRKDSYAIEMDYSYKLREFKYVDEDGNDMMDTWSFSQDSVMSVYITRGFPLKEKFQRYALYIYESGLLQRHSSIIYSRKLNSMQRYSKQKFKRIHVSDFRIHYAILMIGNGISFLCFVIEVLKYETYYLPYNE